MPLSVLIVDDSVTMRRMIIRALKMTSLEIGTFLEAGNGQEGLDVLASEKVDLALVDIHMPVMRGPEMVRKVRATPAIAGLPIVIVSSEASEKRVEEMADMGVSFISKPFTPEQFDELLAPLVAGPPAPGPVPAATIEELARQVFETMAFAFVSDEAVEVDTEATAIRATMAFAGPCHGEFRMAMPIGLLSELADNMLGIDGEPVARRQMLDALGELTNVLGGNLLAELAGSGASWELQHPVVAEDVPDEAAPAGEHVGTLLHLESGWVRIEMIVASAEPATQGA